MCAPAPCVATLIGSHFGYQDGAARVALIGEVQQMALDGLGGLYFADTTNNRIRHVDASGNVTTLAGNGMAVSVPGPAAQASFNSPNGLVYDADAGRLIVAEAAGNRLTQVDLAGNVTEWVGDGTVGYRDSDAGIPEFSDPNGLALDSSHGVYVAEYNNQIIRHVDASGTVTTAAGSKAIGFADGPTGPGTQTRFYAPSSVVLDAVGRVLVGDGHNHRVRYLDFDAGMVGTLAGNGTDATADGPALGGAEFRFPGGVDVDLATGRVFVADQDANLIREIDFDGGVGVVSTLAGSLGLGDAGFADGPPAAALFSFPRRVLYDPTTRRLYVADDHNYRIRAIQLP